MDSSSADTGGDKPRVLKSATLLSRGLGSSGEGAGFRGQSGPAHVNMANGGSGPQKDYSLHGTQLNRKEGAFADHINLNERREVTTGFRFSLIEYLHVLDFFRLISWSDLTSENLRLLVKTIKEDKAIARKCFDRAECSWRGSMFSACFCLVHECNWSTIYSYFFAGATAELARQRC